MTLQIIPQHRLPPPGESCQYAKTDQGCYWCCVDCNHDTHICPGCGTPLSHLGNERTTQMTKAGQITVWRPHRRCTD